MKFKIALIISLFSLILANTYFYFQHPDPVLESRKLASSLSLGDRYYGRLQLWRLYVQKGDWVSASKLENRLDPVDIAYYKNLYDPQTISQTLLSLTSKPNKNIEDYLEIARLHLQLNDRASALEAVSAAKEMDPIRDDISRLFYRLQN